MEGTWEWKTSVRSLIIFRNSQQIIRLSVYELDELNECLKGLKMKQMELMDSGDNLPPPIVIF